VLCEYDTEKAGECSPGPIFNREGVTVELRREERHRDICGKCSLWRVVGRGRVRGGKGGIDLWGCFVFRFMRLSSMHKWILWICRSGLSCVVLHS